LNFMGPIMGSMKSPCRYRLPIETTALNCLVYEKIAFLCTHFGDRQTNRWTALTRKAVFAIASGGLIMFNLHIYVSMAVAGEVLLLVASVKNSTY